VAKYNTYAGKWQCADLNGVVGNTQGFLSNDTFTVPAGVTRVNVEVWGAGGGGGYAGCNLGGGGGGGGGSGGYTKIVLDVSPGQTFSVVIGMGGTGGTPSTGGTAGTESRVTTGVLPPITAGGGQAGGNGEFQTGQPPPPPLRPEDLGGQEASDRQRMETQEPKGKMDILTPVFGVG
jgi:hypothetical protein